MAEACPLRPGVMWQFIVLFLLALIKCDAVAPDAVHAVEPNSSRGLLEEVFPRFEWVSKEELAALARREENALCVAQVPCKGPAFDKCICLALCGVVKIGRLLA